MASPAFPLPLAPLVRRSRRAILRAGLPTPWPESPARQLHRWASDMDGLLGELAATGRPWTLDLWRQGWIAVFSSASARQRLQEADPETFGHANDLASLFVGPHSLLLKDGAEHRAGRRRTVGLVGAERLPVFGVAMRDATDEWLDRLEPDSTVPVLDGCQALTLDIILRTVFGLPPGPEHAALHRAGRGFMQAGRSVAGNLAALVLPTTVLRGLALGGESPGPMARLLGPVGTNLPGSAEGRHLMRRLRELIARRRASDSSRGSDVLSRLVAEGALSDDAIRDEVATLLLAGHDTTAVTLGWLLYRLGSRPDLWDALRMEIASCCGADGLVDPARLPRRGLLGACVRESLRLDGLTIGIVRRARRETTVDGFRIPAGTQVNALVRPRHLDPERWPDPERFDPHRMLGERPGPEDLAPFGAGYRRCVGASFATFEMLVVLAAIARRGRFVRPPDLVVDRRQYGAFPGPSNPIPMRWEPL